MEGGKGDDDYAYSDGGGSGNGKGKSPTKKADKQAHYHQVGKQVGDTLAAVAFSLNFCSFVAKPGSVCRYYGV